MTTKILPINSAPRLPNWPAAAGVMRHGGSALDAMCALFGIVGGTDEERHAGVLNELAAQRSPSISIYDRKYTAHVYPEPYVTDGQVYEALRDYAAQHATEDPAMVAIKRREIMRMVGEWKGVPPNEGDDAYWRNFYAELAKSVERG